MNCIIDLRESRSSVFNIKKLVKMYRNKEIDLRISAIVFLGRNLMKNMLRVWKNSNKIREIGLGDVGIRYV